MNEKTLPVLGPHGFFTLAYREWGDPANPKILVCVHGLTRNGRDFDRLAEALSSEWRVACPDMPGRGLSDWLLDKSDYAIPTYAAACAALVARLGVDTISWLGTSMGGIIGMSLAASPNSPIERLIVNDVGPFIPAEALRHIASYAGDQPHFDSIEQAEAHLRRIYAAFGIKTPADWRRFAENSVIPDAAGGFRLHYDPDIARSFKTDTFEDQSFWQIWDPIRCPTLILRGAESGLLLPDTASEMTRRGPGADLVTFAGCGHAPALVDDDQIAAIREWLRRV